MNYSWWQYGYGGFMFLIWNIYIYSRNNRPSVNCSELIFSCGVFAAAMLMCIRGIIRQKPQFTIRGLLLITLFVAMLCSIYKCFGFYVFVIIAILMYVLFGIYSEHTKDTQ